jgi:plasmid stability protein
VATLTVRNLEDEVVKQLRIRAAQHGRSAEAEQRELLTAALIGGGQQQARQQAADRLAEYRRQISGRGSKTSTELLAESREHRVGSLTSTGSGV